MWLVDFSRLDAVKGMTFWQYYIICEFHVMVNQHNACVSAWPFDSFDKFKFK